MIMEALKKKHPKFIINMHDPPSDGNCFFSAADLALTEVIGIKKGQSKIRSAVCYILKTIYSDIIGKAYVN